jgi:hypothetical protein
MRYATILFFYLLSAGLAVAAEFPPLDPALGVVFPAERARLLLHQCSRDAPDRDDQSNEHVSATWKPDGRQIKRLEELLPAALSAELSKRTQNNDRAKAITRQYAGLVINGRKIIYVNAFPAGALDVEFSPTYRRIFNWQSEPALVCDGGAVFFGVEYDPATEMFSNFKFNGAI